MNSLTELESMLFEHQHAPSHVFALVDGHRAVAADHPLSLDSLRNASGIEVTPVPRPTLSEDVGNWPHLITLRTPNDHGYPNGILLANTLKCAKERCISINGAYVCGWLVAEASAERLAQHLKKAIVTRHPVTHRQVSFPWFEPWRLALAAALESPAVVSGWLGPIRAWVYIGADQHLRKVLPEHEHASVAMSSRISDQMWRASSAIKLGRQVALALRKAGITLPIEPEVAIYRATQEAQKLGLTHGGDIVAFAVQDLTLPAGWHRHAACAHAIANAVRGQARLLDGLTAIADTVWTDMNLSPQNGRQEAADQAACFSLLA